MIEFGPEVEAAIRKHGERAYPEECCGLLLGRIVGACRRVEAAVPMLNARTENRERRFLITPDSYREAERLAEARSLDLIGFYHSHPDHPARPSEYDLEHALPWHSYVVLGVREGKAGDCTSWVLAADRGRFDAEELRVS